MPYKTKNFDSLLKEYETFLEEAIEEVAVTAEEFFKSRIAKNRDLEGKPYKKRSPELRPGRKVLIERGKLRNSIRTKHADLQNGVVISAGNSRVPYAQIHNEGGKIKVTKKMKAYFWAMHAKHKGKVKKRVDGRPRKGSMLNLKKADIYKAMALKQEGSYINMPKRSFIGNSRALTRILESTINQQFERFVNRF